MSKLISAFKRQHDTSSDSKNPRLAYHRVGQGEPLVLLHGQGLSRRSWDPVMARLAKERDVIAVDLPGHGESPRQPRSLGSAPVDLAVAVAGLLDELRLGPVHLAGHSLGGWVALELARQQRAKTVTALAPAGLWRHSAPRHIRIAMRQARLSARVVRRLAPGAPDNRLTKALLLLQASGHPLQVSDEMARTAVHDLATAPGFRETLRALERRRFQHGNAIEVPITVAFGSRDRVLLPAVSRRRDQLPAHTEWITLAGCGHLAMFDDPHAVATLLLNASRSDRVTATG